MSERKKSPVAWIVATVLVLLLGGYIGAYCAMVIVPDRNEIDPAGGGYLTLHPFYAIGDLRTWWKQQGKLRATFAPIHWLDRRIRPSVWESGE